LYIGIKIVTILKNQAKKSDFKEDWVMENWWIKEYKNYMEKE